MKAERLIEPAIELARHWLHESAGEGSRRERRTAAQLEEIVDDPSSVRFVMNFVDRVVRPDSDQVAAAQLRSVVSGSALPRFLNPVDRLLLRAGARLSAALPRIVMPLARRRMRSIVGHLVAPAEPTELAGHLEKRGDAGFALNVNLLGEAVLGEEEAQRRLDELLQLIEEPRVDYVSVKISAIASQLNHHAHEDSLRRVRERLRILFAASARARPATFINLDMEEYHDLELTLTAFMTVLDEPEYRTLDAGIVLQAYLPDSFLALQRLTAWANRRREDGGGETKVRLVKGANLAMEQVDAAIHGWEQAPYGSKVETDANYKRCVDWLLEPDRMRGVRLGLASHNLFDVAWTRLLSVERGVADRVQFEMLQGMAPAQAQTVADATKADSRLLLYTPAVRSENFDVAISYLFRRLEENAADENFMRHLFRLAEDRSEFERQASMFREAMSLRDDVSSGPRRAQDRSKPPIPAYEIGEAFRNEPDTDPVLDANRNWISSVVAASPVETRTPITTEPADIDRVVTAARTASGTHARSALGERQALLHRVGDELARRRGDFITTMMHEASKTFAEADGEVSEAIDFARWYGDRALDLEVEGAVFDPLGVVVVVPPWNFPVAIPAGGVLAALAAGNAVVLKPAPETPRCAELIADACRAAGVPSDLLHFVRTPDDEIGQRLVESADGVILTGGSETADLFTSWRPDMRLFAETSGKNALVITPNADLDLAVADLVRSAFSHGGQKCSAASLAILVGDAYDSERFRRQLIDAVQSLSVGPATAIETDLAPLVSEPNPRLQRGLEQLDDGEEWLVEPRPIGDGRRLWTPGVRLGVGPESWFHRTECFGPVLGLMKANDLDDAIAIQNSSAFGLTGGIHSLDPEEVTRWLDQVEVGNAYVNRAITGAIVQRQPFGGWKQSSVGPGAKAGGPNYVAQLGTWRPAGHDPLEHDYAEAWSGHFTVEHDPTGLFCEANIFRYVSLGRVLLRVEDDATDDEVELVQSAARTTGVELLVSSHESESQEELARRLASTGAQRIRLVGGSAGDALWRTARRLNVHIAEDPVTRVGRIELQHYMREQAISETLHRFGNLTARRR